MVKRQYAVRLRVLGLVLSLTAASGCAGGRYDDIAPGDAWQATVAAHAAGPREDAGPAMRDLVVRHWAEIPLPDNPRPWDLKVRPPRQVLARLASGRDIDNANRFLLDMEIWNASGSEWDVRELWGFDKSYGDRVRFGHRGDYDFTASVLVTILYRFGDRPDRLYPDTRRHIVDNLLPDSGGPRSRVPRSLGLVPETENHLLMTEASRYLLNQWRRAGGEGDPRYDNRRNGLRDWLAALLENIEAGGFHEFNSIPYQGYALQPLMNLAAYAECEDISALSRRILDAELWRYSFSSLNYRRSVPFRRHLRHAGNTDMRDDRMTPIAAVWTLDDPRKLPGPLLSRVRASHFALDAAVAAYRPPRALIAFMRSAEGKRFFIRAGRGRGGSPEIYSGGRGYLLSAGGVAPPWTRQIAVRPIVLLLSDGEHDWAECFHLPSTGRRANRTGVYRRLACADVPVRVPQRFQSAAAAGGWSIYRPAADGRLLVAVYNREDFGLLAVFPQHEKSAATLLDSIRAANPPAGLRECFVFPDTGKRVEYDPDARRTEWVIKTAAGRPLPRDYRLWPRLAGREE